MTSAKLLDISSEDEFNTVLKENTFVLLDFTASWCPPCRMIAPIFEQLSMTNSSQGSLAFAQIDTDRHRGIAAKYGIKAMPTFILIKNGEPIQTIRGANPPALKHLVELAVLDVEKTQAAKASTSTKDEETVSGSYTVSSNSNWKTVL